MRDVQPCRRASERVQYPPLLVLAALRAGGQLALRLLQPRSGNLPGHQLGSHPACIDISHAASGVQLVQDVDQGAVRSSPFWEAVDVLFHCFRQDLQGTEQPLLHCIVAVPVPFDVLAALPRVRYVVWEHTQMPQTKCNSGNIVKMFFLLSLGHNQSHIRLRCQVHNLVRPLTLEKV
jgi:hypothetical protein